MFLLFRFLACGFYTLKFRRMTKQDTRTHTTSIHIIVTGFLEFSYRDEINFLGEEKTRIFSLKGILTIVKIIFMFCFTHMLLI